MVFISTALQNTFLTTVTELESNRIMYGRKDKIQQNKALDKISGHKKIRKPYFQDC